MTISKNMSFYTSHEWAWDSGGLTQIIELISTLPEKIYIHISSMEI